MFSLMLVEKLKNLQSFLMNLKNNFLITKPWVKMICHQTRGKQPKSDVRNHIVRMSYGDIYMLSYLFSEIPLWVSVVSQSNAGEERIFSMVRKNTTVFRSRLQLDGSLNSIVRTKMSIQESLPACHKWKASSSLFKAYK